MKEHGQGASEVCKGLITEMLFCSPLLLPFRISSPNSTRARPEIISASEQTRKGDIGKTL